MAKFYSSDSPLEVDSESSHALISLRAIGAGLVISFFTMTGLLGLGLAFGGIGLEDGFSAKSAGVFTGVWFIVSALISIFVGSYFAARVSKFRLGRVGSAQGLVIAALFLGFFLYQTVAAISSAGSLAGSAIGKTAGALGQGASMASQNDAITGTLRGITQDALGDLNLRSNPTELAQSIGGRLLRGDTEGAKNILAREAGITPTEADSRIAIMKSQVDKAMTDAREGTATALKSTGWSLFLLVALGAIASILGGALGSVANFRRPLVREGYFNREVRA
ncbi:hypothetical protein [Peredibacter starrii]|uniref:PhnA-like protein n=1 Tax=Peredibacter starrii TaxID=28202 RepID=A0AAX4HU62_9BACT|nr:hypothetical protein [Peredibacter starrii]WPU66936.1 hypothetical protein SOO65_09255 [Peredibacter starrii]